MTQWPRAGPPAIRATWFTAILRLDTFQPSLCASRCHLPLSTPLPGPLAIPKVHRPATAGRGPPRPDADQFSQRPHSFAGQVPAFPFHFDRPDLLAKSLEGTEVLYNTYWVRFNHSLFTHADAVRNTRTLFEAARQAGVQRVVHVSITNPSLDSPLEYFRGKAELERALQESGLGYAILRPAVLFGREDILINNIAWALRRLPVFGVFGDGSYRLQPIYVDDLAELAVAWGQSRENRTLEAIGQRRSPIGNWSPRLRGC